MQPLDEKNVKISEKFAVFVINAPAAAGFRRRGVLIFLREGGYSQLFDIYI